LLIGRPHPRAHVLAVHASIMHHPSPPVNPLHDPTPTDLGSYE